MLVSEINNRVEGITFTGKAKIIRNLTKPEMPVTLSGELYEQLSSIVGVFNKLHTSLNSLHSQKENINAQRIFENLKTKFGIKEIFDTPSEGLTLAGREKEVMISTHGYNSLRLRERNSKTGKIGNTLFFHNGKYVKSNVSNEIPTEIEYFRNKEISNPAQFRLNVRERFDEVDFSLLQLRKAIAAPEIQEEIRKVDPERLKAEVAKSFIIKNSAPQPQTPKAQLKSYYQKMLEEQAKTKQKLEQQRAQRALKPYETQFNGVVTMEKREKPLIEVIRDKVVQKKNTLTPVVQEKKGTFPAEKNLSAAEPQSTPVQKRRGRPPKNAQPIDRPKRRFLFPQSSKGCLSAEDLTFVNGLQDSYNEIVNNLHSIKNNITRSKIRNSYGDLLAKGTAGSKGLNFIGIGSDAENFSINIFSYQGKPHLILTAGAENPVSYIINPKGQVMKNPPLVMNRSANNAGASNKVEYYTREEISSLDLPRRFMPLKEELERYNEYILSKISALNARKERFSTPENIGSLAAERNLIDSIAEHYNRFKQNFHSISIPRRKHLLSEVGFETKRGNPAILMRNVGENAESLHVSFPKFDGKRGLKIQVLGENDTVSRVFYILDDKLVKFDAGGDIHARKHGDRKIHYYSQEEIERSGVREYLKPIEERLAFANTQMFASGRSKEEKLMAKIADEAMKKSVDIRKIFVENLQKNLAGLQKELTKNFDSTAGEIGSFAQKGLSQIQQNAVEAIESLKQKLSELLNR